jgi:hypothetical protein
MVYSKICCLVIDELCILGILSYSTIYVCKFVWLSVSLFVCLCYCLLNCNSYLFSFHRLCINIVVSFEFHRWQQTCWLCHFFLNISWLHYFIYIPHLVSFFYNKLCILFLISYFLCTRPKTKKNVTKFITVGLYLLQRIYVQHKIVTRNRLEKLYIHKMIGKIIYIGNNKN